jgi:hypothetical protein
VLQKILSFTLLVFLAGATGHGQSASPQGQSYDDVLARLRADRNYGRVVPYNNSDGSPAIDAAARVILQGKTVEKTEQYRFTKSKQLSFFGVTFYTDDDNILDELSRNNYDGFSSTFGRAKFLERERTYLWEDQRTGEFCSMRRGVDERNAMKFLVISLGNSKSPR